MYIPRLIDLHESRPGLDVLVYTVPLKQGLAARTRFAATLSEAELARANRFHSPRDRDRFIVAHGEMRRLLGNVSQVDAAMLSFAELPGGKPVIDQPESARRWSFNLSHSGDFALLAVTEEAPLGVDIEHKRVISQQGSIARRFFSATEQRVYEAARKPERQEVFFSIWTRKEAVIKALGLGLSMPLDAFDVCSPDAWLGQPAFAIEEINGMSIPKHQWQLRPLDVPDGYAGAVALQSPAAIRIKHWVTGAPIPQKSVY